MSYPILYGSAETAFADNGLGILSDAVSCTITEERNGAFELQMQYPVTGIHFGEIALRSLILAKPNPVDEAQPFRIFRITRPLNGIVTVYAQHISYDLSGVPVAPFTAANAADALGKLKTNAASGCPFSFWTDKSTSAAMTVSKPSSIRSLLGGSEGSALDLYGGEYRWDRFTVRLYGQRGADRGASIRYGKNLTDIKQEENCANVYTGVYPYWLGQDGTLVQLPEKILDAPGSYDFTRVLPLDLSAEWQEQPTEEQLRARAQSYIQANDIGTPKVSLDVSFVQLEQTEEYRDLALLERVELCDTVSVVFPAMGVSATAKVITTVYDVLLERFTKVSIGDARSTLADTLVQQQRAIEQAPTRTAMQQAIDHQTQLITGNRGGHAIMHDSDGDTFPDELLFTDDLDLRKALKLLRINKSGIGFSQSGYNGPYTTAWTLDGVFNASFITTGTLDASKATVNNLNASNITTGTLSADRIAAGSIKADKLSITDLSALKATIGGFTIGQSAIYSGLSSFGGTTNGVYIGTDGISLGGGKFKVDNQGNLTAMTGQFLGTIRANMIQVGGDAGYITGSQIGSGTISGGNIGSGTVGGGNIAYQTIGEGNLGTDSVINRCIQSGAIYNSTINSGAAIEKGKFSQEVQNILADVAAIRLMVSSSISTGTLSATSVDTVNLTVNMGKASWKNTTVSTPSGSVSMHYLG